MPTKPISVLVVDDVPIIRDAVKILIAGSSYAKIVGEAVNGEKAVELAETVKPDIILMDIDMPVMNGIEAANIIRQKALATKIVMLTSCNNEMVMFTSFAAGADGYILKDKFPSTIEAAITTVRLGSVWLDPAIARRILDLAGQKTPSKSLNEPLSSDEVSTLSGLKDCTGSHCLVDRAFVANLHRLAPIKLASDSQWR